MGLPAVEAVELWETRRGSSRPTLRIVRIVNTSSPNNVRNAKGGTYRISGGIKGGTYRIYSGTRLDAAVAPQCVRHHLVTTRMDWWHAAQSGLLSYGSVKDRFDACHVDICTLVG